ncbi:MAG: FAD:protein FMN transferase [Candidatus Aminicenantes bacterium]
MCEIKVFCFPSEFSLCQQKVADVFSEIESHFSPGSQDYFSPIVIDLYHKALEVYHHSGGSFDITVGSLSRIWGFMDKSFRLPAPEQIREKLDLIGMDKIQEKKGALILKPDMELDWGSIAKGFGVDLAFRSLESIPVEKGFINAGGDLYCWGKNPENDNWKIGIKHPRKQGYLGILSISGAAASTSGDYQRFFEKDGVRYHHILNPSTGYPAQGKQSVTVIGPQTLMCDALSTALFVSEEPENVLKEYPGYGAILVDDKGKISILGKAYSFRPL